MSNHIELSEGSAIRARSLMDCIRKLTSEIARLDDLFAAMAQMKTGDGSSAAHFDIIASLFAVQAEGESISAHQKAKTLHDELSSVIANSAALRQLLALLG